MAWIELHQTLPRHPKLFRLANKLGIETSQAAGHLVFLWLWALDYAEGGNLCAMTPAEISAAASYKGDPTNFLSALQECGWLHADLTIHDWHDYAGKLVDKRVANRKRMRDARKKEQKAHAQNVQRTCSARAGATVQYSTAHNTTGPDKESPSARVVESASVGEWEVAPGISIPDGFRTVECKEAIEFWLTYKKEKRQGYKPQGLKALMSTIEKDFTPSMLVEAVRKSAAAGWQGLFPASAPPNGAHRRSEDKQIQEHIELPIITIT